MPRAMLVFIAVLFGGCGDKQIVVPTAHECNALRIVGMDEPTPDITHTCGVLPLVKDSPLTKAQDELDALMTSLECKNARPVASFIVNTVEPLVETLMGSERPLLRLAGTALKASFAGPKVMLEVGRNCPGGQN